jgi:hypothetical protein
MLVEPYLINEANAKTYDEDTYQYHHLVLGEDEYFVMGDNRGASLDSRSLGAIKAKDIYYRQSAKPTFRFYLDLVIMLILFVLSFCICTIVENWIIKFAYLVWHKKNGNTSNCTCASNHTNKKEIDNLEGDNK